MIIHSLSSWMGDRYTQRLLEQSSNQVHSIVSVQPLSCTALSSVKQKEILQTFWKIMFRKEKERHLVQQLNLEWKTRTDIKSRNTKQINQNLFQQTTEKSSNITITTMYFDPHEICPWARFLNIFKYLHRAEITKNEVSKNILQDLIFNYITLRM